MRALVFAIGELWFVLLDLWRDVRDATDLRHRLRCWWEVVTGAVDLDRPLPLMPTPAGVADLDGKTAGQLMA